MLCRKVRCVDGLSLAEIDNVLISGWYLDFLSFYKLMNDDIRRILC